MRYRSLLAGVLLVAVWQSNFLAALFLPTVTLARPTPLADAPEVASYQMDVELDPTAKTVTGSERITYRNPSDDTLEELWLRLYLKAFSSPDTVWMQESGGSHRGFTTDAESLGDITVSTLALPDGTDLLAGSTISGTLMRVPLPAPLEPDATINLEVAWTSKLPRVFARTGYGGRDDTFFMVGQWYPKMVVYADGAWDTIPWHANAEFFHDFGNYDVQITVPSEYVVAGAGVPSGEPVEQDGRKTVRFVAEDVTDFAFAASPDFKIRTAPAGDSEVVLYYLPEHAAAVDTYMDVAVGSLQAYSDWYGDYPHPRLSVIDVPDSAAGAGGMEYPTLITGGTLGAPIDSGFVALVVAHEVGHQWWPMQTATHEGRAPWLDEGVTQYSGSRYMHAAGLRVGSSVDALSLGAFAMDRAAYAANPDVPSDLPAWEYDGFDYGVAAYSKPSVGLFTLEQVVGTERFRQAMADYLETYRYRHPTSADFRQSLESSLDTDLDWFFDDFIGGTGVIDYAVGEIENTPTGSTVTVSRTGEVRVPVEIRVTLASGAQQMRTWEAREQQTSLTFPPGDPVRQVKIDPEYKLAAEFDRMDNGISTTVEVGPTTTLGGRLLFLFQAVVQTVGLFG